MEALFKKNRGENLIGDLQFLEIQKEILEKYRENLSDLD